MTDTAMHTDWRDYLTERGASKAKFLGLAGFAGSGKDHVFDYIKRHTILPAFRIAFADGVREEVARFLGIGDPGKTFTKPYSKEVRFVLQQWGTELRRAEDLDYWVKYGMEAATEIEFMHECEPVLIVFTDVRFQNEADAIRAQGGRVLQVTAGKALREQRLGITSTPSHTSEVIDFQVDGEIMNEENGLPPMFDTDDAIWLRI